jgi:hypothetical protein
MEVYEVIEEPSYYKWILMETREIVEDLVSRESKILEEEFFTLHHLTYHNNCKKC